MANAAGSFASKTEPLRVRSFSGRNVPPGVLKHRREVVSRVTRERILEVEEAEMRDSVASFDQHDVLGMIITKDGHRPKSVALNRLEHLAPRAAIAFLIDLGADRRAIPVGEQFHFLEPLLEAVLGQVRHRRVLVQVDEHFRRDAIQFALARRVVVEPLREAVHRQAVHWRVLVQMDENVGRKLVQFALADGI